MTYPDLRAPARLDPGLPAECPVCSAAALPEASADAVDYRCGGRYQRVKDGWPCAEDLYGGECPTGVTHRRPTENA